MPVEIASAAQPPSDTADFDRLVRPNLEALYARALRFERHPVEAHDLVQDTLERALRRQSQFRPGSNVRVWLFTIMFHLFIDRCRRRSHELASDHVETDELMAQDRDDDDPWAVVNDAQLQSALDRLPGPFREIVELHCVRRCSYREIATRLDIPLGTVGTRLLRARRKLRDLLCQEAPALAGLLLGD